MAAGLSAKQTNILLAVLGLLLLVIGIYILAGTIAITNQTSFYGSLVMIIIGAILIAIVYLYNTFFKPQKV